MKLACVSAEGRGETDRILAQTAALLERDGIRTSGIVKVLDHESAFANGCDMVVRVLPDGPQIKITQSLGEGSDACRLDPGAIAQAVSTVENAELDEASVFILNKFGPEEAAGRGFCAVIGKALERGIPVLVGVGASRANFDSFASGLATDLPADPNAIRAWCRGD
ncbi:DUF2478 domain-containing protein [Aliisedimentitalea scapharcae]|uniref:DUF2478 domain-containing protein n=1 Tax=Aliisedimentitalea scapharcae TaxID=1524259 RepID=A0ABZ2XV09_9RHOB|nr:DUF2478 domain-containing protein [Rhodobacteraceae bacterium M382]